MPQPNESPEIEGLIQNIALAHCRIDALFAFLEQREIIASQEQLENESQKIFQRDIEARRDSAISYINIFRHQALLGG